MWAVGGIGNKGSLNFGFLFSIWIEVTVAPQATFLKNLSTPILSHVQMLWSFFLDTQLALRYSFSLKKQVLITSPFEGEVEKIIPDKGMVRIITTIFGRPTPLELEYWQTEKI